MTRCGILLGQKNKYWIIKALDRGSKRTIAWVTGRRDASTFRQLYDKVKHLKNCTFFTDNWHVFSKILPKDIIGKKGTVCIERDNTRHCLGRMTRRTKIVSKKGEMVYGSIKLWVALSTLEIFAHYQEAFLSMFR